MLLFGGLLRGLLKVNFPCELLQVSLQITHRMVAPKHSAECVVFFALNWITFAISIWFHIKLELWHLLFQSPLPPNVCRWVRSGWLDPASVTSLGGWSSQCPPTEFAFLAIQMPMMARRQLTFPLFYQVITCGPFMKQGLKCLVSKLGYCFAFFDNNRWKHAPPTKPPISQQVTIGHHCLWTKFGAKEHEGQPNTFCLMFLVEWLGCLQSGNGSVLGVARCFQCNVARVRV